MQRELADIRKLLLFIVIPLTMYIFHVLSIIFIPLFFGFFGALLFLPIMRWFSDRQWPKILGLIVVLLIVGAIGVGVYALFVLVWKEVGQVNDAFLNQMDLRFHELTQPLVNYTGNSLDEIGSKIIQSLKSEKFLEGLFGNVTVGIGMVSNYLSLFALSLFFMVLLLAGSFDIHKLLTTLFKGEAFQKERKPYKEIENVVLKYILVKTFISFLTGLGFTIACSIFGVSFPILWGVVAFFLNFIQFIGPAISVVVIAIFAIVELNFSGTWVFFTLITVAVHVLTGGITEPVIMGKSFSINTITVLIMVALWGVIWGIPGMILSIPITALLKKVMEKYKATAKIANLMS